MDNHYWELEVSYQSLMMSETPIVAKDRVITSFPKVGVLMIDLRFTTDDWWLVFSSCYILVLLCDCIHSKEHTPLREI